MNIRDLKNNSDAYERQAKLDRITVFRFFILDFLMSIPANNTTMGQYLFLMLVFY
ncbi:MAG: hypothetical protein JWN76_1609 [Chitinophagaceae bacterium]|nr:hypothetical protein [Chitinophagaceae bacterium]